MLIFILLSLLLAFLALLAVAYPILAKRRAGEAAVAPASAEETIDELLGQRDAVFQALRELRFDHEVGKITDGDYVAFEGNLKLTAANSLRALDDWEARVDRELSSEIERVAATKAALAASAAVVCPRCGNLSAPEDRFCGRCGADLSTAAATPPLQPVCSRCGRPYEAGARFCAGCGRALTA
jgi:hypothetical protein